MNGSEKIYCREIFGDTALVYWERDKQLSLMMIPASETDKIAPHRQFLCDLPAGRDLSRVSGWKMPAYHFEPLTQLKFSGDASGAEHAAGATMRGASRCETFRLKTLKRDGNSLRSVFEDGTGIEFTQLICFFPESGVFEFTTTVANRTAETQRLEYLPSFSLGFLSPFQSGAVRGKVHRFRSAWSAECRPEVRTLEELGLECSWQGAGFRSLRFGQRSTMPVKEFYPFLAFEDDINGICWGAEISAAGPWELELSRRDDFLNLSGGQIDREFGNWYCDLKPGGSFTSPAAYAACVKGSCDDLCRRFRAAAARNWQKKPDSDPALPLIFNEWCTTWGTPSPEKLEKVISRAAELGCRYFVLDAGWFKGGIGDWQVKEELYPQGLKAFAQSIRDRGMIPGIWFEYENVESNSGLYRDHPEYLLYLDGKIVRAGNRAFLNFTLPEVRHYLDSTMIALLKECGFGYMKIDYNAAVSPGADAPDGACPAEMLRRQVDGVTAYFSHLREELPDLVIEMCSSGGHRITPYWIDAADMISGTDAHEGVEIPLICAQESRLIPLRSHQVWVTLRPDDSSDRLYYSLAAGMMGRLVLSGNADLMNASQLSILKEGLAFYRRHLPHFIESAVRVPQTAAGSWNEPVGCQLHLRETADRALVIFHTFGAAPQTLHCEIAGAAEIADKFLPQGVVLKLNGGKLEISGVHSFTGGAILLTKK